jgi:hypothetical protein
MRQLAFALLCTGLVATQATASIIVYTDVMSGANETPSNGSPAAGTAVVTVNTVANTLAVNITWSGLTAAASAAHIHCCAGPGVAAPVALPFNAFPAATSGTYNNGGVAFDLTNAATYTSGFLTMGGGTAAGAETLLLNSLASGMTYTNIHDSNFPGGEIRGQLAATPEPATLTLVAGLLGLISVVRGRRCRLL